MLSLSKTHYYYQPKKSAQDEDIILFLQDLATQHKRWGFSKMMQKIRLEDKRWNHKRVYRIYKELGLNLRVKPRKRLPLRERKVLQEPVRENVCWSMDFMTDVLRNGQNFRTLNVLDDFNREALLIQPSYNLPSTKVTYFLERLFDYQGKPATIRVDNGPEFIAKHFKQWAKQHGITIQYIQPGKPAQNGYIERFNRTYREDVLDSNLFDHLHEVKEITNKWLTIYNEERPHDALGGLTPQLFKLNQLENSTFN